MKKKLFLFLVLIQSINLLSQSLQVEKLRCEYKENPLGIDVKTPRFCWLIKTDTVQKNIMQTAYRIQVVANNPKFDNNKNLVWDSNKVKSSQSIHLEYEGKALKPQTRYYWRVKIWDNQKHESKWSETAYWETGINNASLWKAQWIVADIPEIKMGSNPLPMLRKEFAVKNKIKKARLYITSHGLYQASINGKLLTDYLFTPGWTSYKKRLQYQVYDVSNFLKQGKNATGVILGDGWYRGTIGFQNTWENLALLYQLEIEYTNGEKQMILSDDSWKSNTGPILSATIYNGILYDANKEIENWDNVNFNDKEWKGVNVKDYSKEIIVQNIGLPVRRTQEIKAIKKIITPKKEIVLDFGQNLTGRVRFNLKGTKGDTLTILHAEVLDKEGNFYTDNLRTAKQKVQYIFKDNKTVVFEPEFTFQGFRYIQIKGAPSETITTNNFVAEVIHSDMESTGFFECSDKLINQLHQNIRWGMRGNFLDIPTDCPQRDERLGWTGDVQAFSSTSNFLFNTAPFYLKWLEDLKVDQREDGAISHVVPMTFSDFGSTGWGDVATILPFNLYMSYGDKNILKNQYNSMKAWVDYLSKNVSSDMILRTNSNYGDWLFFIHPTDWSVKPGYTDRDLIATAFLAHSAHLLSQAAKITDNNNDLDKYNLLFESVKKAFQKEFLTQTGRLSSNSQTAYSLALAFDLIPENMKQNALKYLTDNIKERNNHISTGFLGTPLINHVLSENGANDIAYKLLLQKDYPSWLYPISKGATTIWERWDGIKPNGDFQTTEMNSFNHYAYGAIGSWLYSKVAGIQSDINSPGYKHIILKPMPDSSLNFVKAKYTTLYGTIEIMWKKNAGKFSLSAVIPSNTTATIYLPYSNEIKKVGSGKYVFNYEVK